MSIPSLQIWGSHKLVPCILFVVLGLVHRGTSTGEVTQSLTCVSTKFLPQRTTCVLLIVSHGFPQHVFVARSPCHSPCHAWSGEGWKAQSLMYFLRPKASPSSQRCPKFPSNHKSVGSNISYDHCSWWFILGLFVLSGRIDYCHALSLINVKGCERKVYLFYRWWLVY